MEPRREHANNLGGCAIEAERPPDDCRVSSQYRALEGVGEDHRGISAGLILFVKKRPAS